MRWERTATARGRGVGHLAVPMVALVSKGAACVLHPLPPGAGRAQQTGDPLTARVEIRLCPVLSAACSEASVDVDLAEGTTVDAAVGSLGIRPGSGWIASVNGALVGGDTPLVEGDRLYVFAPVSGG